ncbi:competence protein ComEA [Rodentibacter caecimuris]|uniref:Competence protein ComEA n=1 Tax=Rodentibacter caecimuris TaxID=1796644 RepID=A0A9X8YYT0_9PAST|nr:MULTISPECIES: helix-hairpin-helix domain-containing protein [Pasteurellaceae]AOF54509.1 DNA uptake protein-related DNA-binding protein [Pasteurellaceae bacterium NI1060]MCQ9122716.1 helix-hairpin-helix domain-containing protein [Rodentibacter heylii]MCR1838483.1 helix-hairpin-helix domain-containing protein [Pasteurella caecimuris]MCU0107807.1 helix-hairpin-helix domain-containing protein [Pasteurella caecimuris]OOF72158.1 competence protein ComEA [Rodentibacter heylii]
MKSLKSLLTFTALSIAVAGSAFSNENTVTTLKKESVTNVNSMIQKQKENAIADKNSLKEKVVATKEKAKEAVKSTKEATKEKIDVVKEKANSMKSSDTSSMKNQVSEKFNSAKEQIKTEKQKIASSAKVNINKADAETLQKLSGIGEKKAQAIVDYRNKMGKIKNVAELSKIDGLGETTIEKIAPYLTF